MIYLILAVTGAMVGALINWCIYNLGDKKLPISPWFADSKSLAERIPIVGWWMRRSSGSETFGKIFWLRPMLIELVWLIGMPWFYHWQISGGLIGGGVPPAGFAPIWFIGHSILFALLFVATFIDFDQRIIPDGITLPGTLVALLLAAVWPCFRLPEVNSGMAGTVVEPLHFADSQPLGTWHHGWQGMGIGILIFAVWIIALLPKFSLMGINWNSLKVVFISTVRFLQSNGLKVRERTCKLGRRYLLIGLIGCLAIAVAWQFLPALHKDSLFGSLAGLGFGGMMVWSVRIVATHSLGREAMGFGDVTLMAMIGAFLGWQPSLLVFGISPFAALAIVAVSFIITRDSELAFGPYLCLGALIVVLCWSSMWPPAERQFFLFPKMLITVLAACLVLLMLMMLGLRVIKGDPDEETGDMEQDSSLIR